MLGTSLVPLYFMYAGAPPAWNVLTRSFVNLVTAVAIFIFIVGLAHLIRRAGERFEWLAGVVSSAGLMYVTVTLIAISLEAGVVLDQPDGTVDPTVDGPIAHANMLLHGSVPRLLTAVMLAAAGYAILRSGALSRWAGRSAYLLAAINLAFVPSLFFGDDAEQFYSAVGWGTAASAATLLLYWALAVGIALLRRPAASPPMAAPTDGPFAEALIRR